MHSGIGFDLLFLEMEMLGEWDTELKTKCGEKVRGRDKAGEGVVDMGEHRERPRREVNEIRGVYGPEQHRDLEKRHIGL